MGCAVIPVDLLNPGEVFACLGFLEAAEALSGPAAGGFEWNPIERFILEAEAAENPVRSVLEFLASVAIRRLVPPGWIDPPKKKRQTKQDDDADTEEDTGSTEISADFPSKQPDRMYLPIRLGGANGPAITLGHWADESSRNSFKLYAGNRSAAKIAADMLGLIARLWKDRREALIESPLDTLCKMGGSFNFDPRGAWTAIDAGYSPDKHKTKGGNVFASPVVELLAAWGMEHARPDEFEVRKVRYRAWQGLLPPILARAALGGALAAIRSRHFHFQLAMSGKANKVVCFAQEEPTP